MPKSIAELFVAKGIDDPGWGNVTFRLAARTRPQKPDNLEIPFERARPAIHPTDSAANQCDPHIIDSEG